MYRVIIVDDEKLIRRSIEQRINWQKLGLTIAGAAGNGQEALELIAAVQPHIVLVDIRMPLMDGLSLIREAQRRGFNKIFFVIISGYEVCIDKSKFFMETEDLSVTEIASRVGYNDANYFSKVFKKNTGQSPSQYLDQVRQSAAK